MDRQALNPPTMPPPGPYSHVWRVSLGDVDLVVVSGQLGTDVTGHLVGRGDLIAQAKQAMENIRAAVEGAGGTLSDIIKLTTYLTDLSSRAEVRALRAEMFPVDPPASTTVQVTALMDPEALVEVEALAVISRRDRGAQPHRSQDP